MPAKRYERKRMSSVVRQIERLSYAVYNNQEHASYAFRSYTVRIVGVTHILTNNILTICINIP